MKRIDVKSLGKRVAGLPAMFPVEVFICLLQFCLFEATEQWDVFEAVRKDLRTSLAVIPLCFFASFVLNRWTKARGKGRWAYYAVVPVAVASLWTLPAVTSAAVTV